MLASRYGIGAIDQVHKAEFGVMVALRGTDIVTIPLVDAIHKTRPVDPELVEVAMGLIDPISTVPVNK